MDATIIDPRHWTLDTIKNQLLKKEKAPYMSLAARVTCPAAGDGKSHAAGDSAATCVHLITSPGVTLYPRLVKTLGCCWGCVLAWHRGPPLADTDEGLQAGPGRSFENNQAIN